MAQLAARQISGREVQGSIPCWSKKKRFFWNFKIVSSKWFLIVSNGVIEKFFLFSFGNDTSTLTDIIHFRQISQKYLSDILLRNTFRTFTYLHHLQTYEIGTKKCKLRLLATNSFFVVSHLYLYLLSTYLVRDRY